MPAPLVHFITRKPLLNNARVFKQAQSLRRGGYDVVLLGVQRGPLPAQEQLGGIAVMRVPHDPLPRSVSAWARRNGDSPTTVRHVAPEGAGGRARRALMRVVRAAGTLPWLLQSLVFYVRSYRLLARLPAPAVVHVSDLNALLVGVVHARRHRCPLVFDAQELFTGQHQLPRMYRALLSQQERLLLRAVDRLIVVNPAIAEVMRQRYGRSADAVLLNCPPYQDRLEGPDIRDRLGLPAQAQVIAYCGALLPARGLEQVILALHHLPGAYLVVLGEGQIQPQLEALAAQAGLARRVRFHPYIPHDEVPAFIHSADVGVIPYQDVGPNQRLCSPSKLFHYLMAELPVAASDFPYLRSVIAGEGVGTLFDPADPAAIAAAIGAVLKDPARFRQHLPEVRRRYCWEHEERTLLALYASLPGGIRPGAAPAVPTRPRPSGAANPRPS